MVSCLLSCAKNVTLDQSRPWELGGSAWATLALLLAPAFASAARAQQSAELLLLDGLAELPHLICRRSLEEAFGQQLLWRGFRRHSAGLSANLPNDRAERLNICKTLASRTNHLAEFISRTQHASNRIKYILA
jgi:hypothetical protein